MPFSTKPRRLSGTEVRAILADAQRDYQFLLSTFFQNSPLADGDALLDAVAREAESKSLPYPVVALLYRGAQQMLEPSPIQAVADAFQLPLL